MAYREEKEAWLPFGIIVQLPSLQYYLNLIIIGAAQGPWEPTMVPRIQRPPGGRSQLTKAPGSQIIKAPIFARFGQKFCITRWEPKHFVSLRWEPKPHFISA